MKRTSFKTRGKPLQAKTPMNRVSAKRRAYRASGEWRAELAYMARVKELPCCTCGAPPPTDAHHCKDSPPFDWNKGKGPYVRLATAKEKSSGFDTIPLCRRGCHQHGPNAYHQDLANFHRLYGKDYEYIEETRRKI